jgi:hypothetical protein
MKNQVRSHLEFFKFNFLKKDNLHKRQYLKQRIFINFSFLLLCKVVLAAIFRMIDNWYFDHNSMILNVSHVGFQLELDSYIFHTRSFFIVKFQDVV